MSSTSFRRRVWNFYKKHGRHDLPWRATRDPYKILVSEVMLQQTQVERVIPYYRAFIKKYPTARRLAAAPLAEVLKAWQGLGYNRRAKMLREAANKLSRVRLRADDSELIEKLEALPGVGSYTARAVAAFAFDRDTVFVETNIRTAVIHHFFQDRKSITDKEILAVLETVMPQGRSREWNLALMDYGAHLKRSGIRLNRRSRHYVKQSKFAGSSRQVRGEILKALSNETPLARVRKIFSTQFDAALATLAKDGLIKKEGRVWRVA